MSILITGGAGYIGSHTVASLLNKTKDIVIFDNLERGHKESLLGGKLFVGDLRNKESLKEVFHKYDIEAVIHFAAYIEVGESVLEPLKFYNNNVISTLNLLTQMKESNVKKIVFSSTAATYGQPKNIPIVETDETIPQNPYGETKLTVEKALKWAKQAYGIEHIILRYFNASGAHESGEIGEDHNPETHLIPIILNAALGKIDSIKIFGDDYDTSDGTCIRDYIHVSDLAKAHILALDALNNKKGSTIYNLGNGKGFSVKEVLNTAREVTGVKIKEQIVDRRLGDPAVLIASHQKAVQELNWNIKYKDLSSIIDSAWNWHKNHPNGFSK